LITPLVTIDLKRINTEEMDEYKLKDYTERLKKETTENAHKMLYMWIKQDVISLNEYQQLVLNLSLQIVSGCIKSDKYGEVVDAEFDACNECKYSGNTGVEDVCLYCCSNNKVMECYR